MALQNTCKASFHNQHCSSKYDITRVPIIYSRGYEMPQVIKQMEKHLLKQPI